MGPAQGASLGHVSASPLIPERSRASASLAGTAEVAPDQIQPKQRQPLEDESAVPLKTLEELTWQNTFVDELPGDIHSDNTVRIVRNAAYSLVRPSLKLKDPQVVAASASAAADCLGLLPQELERPEFPYIFTGADVPRGCKPYAQCYGGHQFGSWAGQLGDGRAITLGEVVPDPSPSGPRSASPSSPLPPERWEVQLKGVGKTPFSRMADGRAVLRSSIREFLCSEAMHALGVPTTRALSIVTTGEEVLRDMFYNGNAKFEPGAAVCRLAPSFIRFGTFQLPVSRGGLEKGLAKQIADYAIRHHFPQFKDLPEPETDNEVEEAVATDKDEEAEDVDPDDVDVSRNKYAAWFADVAERTGRLVAAWQGVGFTHGVLNTDNMSILGLTVDYGPFGFLDEFDPQYTPNTTDLPGRRYCYQNQPDIGMWNIVQLANALHTGGLVSVPEAQHCVSRYANAFVTSYQRTMAAKLGMLSYDKELTHDLLSVMAKHSADFTNTFRALAAVPLSADGPEVPSKEDLLRPLDSVLGLQLSEGGGDSDKANSWAVWLRRWVEKVRGEQAGAITPEFIQLRRERMLQANPKYILRNYLCQEAIEAAEKGDYEPTRRLLHVLHRPFEVQEGAEDLCMPAPKWAKKPGVCMLSCSS